ncbi:hypothetical protein D3C81_1564480 [compost metagenome]
MDFLFLFSSNYYLLFIHLHRFEAVFLLQRTGCDSEFANSAYAIDHERAVHQDRCQYNVRKKQHLTRQ